MDSKELLKKIQHLKQFVIQPPSEVRQKFKVGQVPKITKPADQVAKVEKFPEIEQKQLCPTSDRFFSAKELAEFASISEKTITRIAVKEGWISRTREGKLGGGGKEYAASSLPAVIRSKVVLKTDGLEVKLTDEHLAISRLRVAEYVLSIAKPNQGRGKSHLIAINPAINNMLDLANKGELDSSLIQALTTAGQNKGKLPSYMSVGRWVKAYRAGQELKPATAGKEIEVPTWFDEFMLYYRRPTCLGVKHAWQMWRKNYWGADFPALDAVYYNLKKVGAVSQEVGRLGKNEIVKIKPYIRRETGDLYPASAYTADGHCADIEVMHPFIPKALVRPEVTIMMDIHTRVVVGVGYSLAENTVSIAHALASACTNWAIPAHFYTDNGKGFKNKAFDDPTLGILPRLGIKHRTGLPRRSQARGMIERIHQTILVKLAQEHAGFIGKTMDTDAKSLIFKQSRKALKEGKKSSHHMSWKQFVKLVDERINEYNHSPHSALPNKATPEHFWQMRVEELSLDLTRAQPEQFALISRPSTNRKTDRGWIQFANSHYFLERLAELSGEEVEIRFDLKDNSRVWCFWQGRYLGVALINGNSRPYFEDITVHEQKVNQSAKAKLARHQRDIDIINAETNAQSTKRDGAEAVLNRLLSQPNNSNETPRLTPEQILEKLANHK